MRGPSRTNAAFMFVHIGTKSWMVTVPPVKVAVPWYFGRLPMSTSRFGQSTLHGVSWSTKVNCPRDARSRLIVVVNRLGPSGRGLVRVKRGKLCAFDHF